MHTLQLSVTALVAEASNLQQPEPGQSRWVACALIFGLLALAAVIVLIAGLVTRHFFAFKFQLVLLTITLAAAGLLVTFWTLKVTGYQNVGYSAAVPNVSKTAVEIIERTGSVLIALLFAVFTIVLVTALLETHYPESKRSGLVFGIGCGVVALLATAYAMTMGVYSSTARNVFVPDVSPIVLSGMMLLFAGALVGAFGFAARLTKTSEAAAEESRRNVIIFLWASVVFAALFLIRFVVTALFLFRDYAKYLGGYVVLKIVCDALTGLAVLAYVGMAVYPSVRRARKPENRGGYVPLEEENNGTIPQQYEA